MSPHRGCWPGELEAADQKQASCDRTGEGACLELEYELEVGTKIREVISCQSRPGAGCDRGYCLVSWAVRGMVI